MLMPLTKEQRIERWGPEVYARDAHGVVYSTHLYLTPTSLEQINRDRVLTDPFSVVGLAKG